MPDNALTRLALQPDEAAAFWPSSPAAPLRGVTGADYARGAGNTLVALARGLLPPTPNEYMWGMAGYEQPPPGVETAQFDDGRMWQRPSGGEWQPMEQNRLAGLGAFFAPMGIGAAPQGAIASGVPLARKMAPMVDWDPIGAARKIAADLEARGFKTSLEPSSTSAGRSAYLTFTDPQTGRQIGEPIRFSDHSLGPTRSRYTPQVYNDAEAEEVLARAMRMREAGVPAPDPATVAAAEQRAANQQAARAATDDAARMDDLAKQLYPEEWGRWEGRTGAAASKARQDMRRRARQSSGGGT